MEAIIIHPRTQEQLTALKSLFKVMEVPFEKANDQGTFEEESPYDQEFVAKIKRGEKAAKEGKGLKVNMENLWK